MQPNSHPPTSHCSLNPVTSLNTSRYANPGCIQLCPQVINRGPTSRGRLAQSPRRFVHPEGQPYFVLTGESDFAVVTEANVEDEQITGRILDCVRVVTKELQSHSIKVHPRCELFLESGDDGMTYNYYFVDHVGKELFWLEDIGTEMLDIPAAVSSSHLETALERLYWVHVEFFPMHHESHEQDPEFSQIADDLYNIISHGQADRLTSKTSTFPYTADTCRQFLKLLSRKRGQPMDGYTLCYAARLAGAITNQRFVTFYGQRSAQLDRLQEMFPADVVEHKWLPTVADLVMWGIPRRYNNLFQDLYVNEQLYADQWTHFISMCLADWTNSLSWSFLVLIAAILLANMRGGTVFMSIPSVLSCAISIASASCLHLRHQPLAESSATVGTHYLRSAKWNGLGFLPSAVAFSLPRASYLWGVGLLTTQIIFIASQTVSRTVALFFSCTIAETLVLMLYVLHPEANITSLYRSLVCMLWTPAKPSHWSRDTPVPLPLLASRTVSN